MSDSWNFFLFYVFFYLTIYEATQSDDGSYNITSETQGATVLAQHIAEDMKMNTWPCLKSACAHSLRHAVANG